MKKKFFQSTLIKWIHYNKRNFPWRKENITPYEQLVAEIMLIKTNARGVIDVYNNFMKAYPTKEKLSKGKITKIKKLIRSLGLYKSRSRLLKKVPYLLNKNNISFDQLFSEKGIGMYVSSSFFCFCYGQRIPIIDTNVIRLFSRYFGKSFNLDPRRDKNIFDFAEDILPIKKYIEFNYALLDLPALICKPKNPNCSGCPLAVNCLYSNNQNK